MIINGTDISTWDARQLTTAIDTSTMDHYSDWGKGAVVPFLSPVKVTWKSVSIVLAVYGDTREEIRANCAAILAEMAGPVILQLDGREHRFRGMLTKSSITERVFTRYCLLNLEVQCYEYDEQTTVSGSSSVTVTCNGHITSPCRVEITPRIGVASITLTGICRDSFTGEDLPVTIEDLVTGKSVVLDGVTGEVSEDGTIKEVDMWTLPTLVPGANVITCSNANMTIAVTPVPIFV